MKRIFLIADLVLVIFSADARQQVLNPAEFTHEYAKVLQEESPGSKISIIDDLQIKVTPANGKEFTAFLDNAYDAYKQDPSDKDVVIKRFVASGLETITAPKAPINKNRIVPVVKDRGWLEDNKQSLIQRGAKKTPEFVYEDLNSDLVVLYAVDSPKNISYLTPDELEKNGIRRADLRTMAIANLKAILPKIECHGTNGVYILTAGGDYDASLLLLDSIWSSRQIEVLGEVVVAIPTRDLLLITGSQDKLGIEKVRGMVKRTMESGSYRLTNKLFVYRDGHFSEFKE